MMFHEWVYLFEKKTGERFYWNPEYNIEFAPDNSFMIWYISGDYVVIDQTCGDGKYWKEFIFEKASKHKGLLKTTTRRNPNAFNRIWGTRVTNESIGSDGRTEYTLEVKV